MTISLRERMKATGLIPVLVDLDNASLGEVPLWNVPESWKPFVTDADSSGIIVRGSAGQGRSGVLLPNAICSMWDIGPIDDFPTLLEDTDEDLSMFNAEHIVDSQSRYFPALGAVEAREFRSVVRTHSGVRVETISLLELGLHPVQSNEVRLVQRTSTVEFGHVSHPEFVPLGHGVFGS